MEVTEVKVRLVEDRTERLRAFCTITLDSEFVVRDIKIIDGAKGLFVAMPSRKLMDHCPKCGSKNHLRAKFCNECGAHLPGNRAPNPTEASGKLHVDVAHPINSECRSRIQRAILSAYENEVRRHAAASPPSSPAATEEVIPPPPEPSADAGPTEETSPDAEKTDDQSFGAGIL